MSFKIRTGTLLILCTMIFSCQKDKDILDRFTHPPSKELLTTVISYYPGHTSRDTIFWFQDGSGQVDSAYRYDTISGRRKKVFSVRRDNPAVISIDDGEEGKVSADILFNGMGQPYKVIFFDRISRLRFDNSYNFSYGNAITPDGLEMYMDSVYSSLTLEAYGFMSTPDYKYPIDSFEKLSAKMGTFISGDYIYNTRRGADLSAFSFVPFVGFVVTSNLSHRYPSAMHYNIFDAYIWGEVMRPWLPKELILGFYDEEFYPVIQPVMYYNYNAQVSRNRIMYTDGYMTITNNYP